MELILRSTGSDPGLVTPLAMELAETQSRCLRRNQSGRREGLRGATQPPFLPDLFGPSSGGVLPDDQRLALAAIRELRLLLMDLVEAYGFKVKVAFNLAKAGLATGHTGRVPTGGRAVEVFGVQITDGGRALAEWRG
jgi:hypothetical protein